MYTRLRPQVAQHSSGYRVEVRSRQAVALVEEDASEIIAEIEFGPVSTIYRHSLTKRRADGGAVPMADSEVQAAAERILSGMKFLGGNYELV